MISIKNCIIVLHSFELAFFACSGQEHNEQTTNLEMNLSVSTMTPVFDDKTFPSSDARITANVDTLTEPVLAPSTIPNITTAPIVTNDGQKGSKETNSPNWKTTVFAVIGVIVSVIVLLIIFLGVRFHRKQKNPSLFTATYKANSTSNTNTDDSANQNVYDSPDSTEDKIVINQIYIAFDERNNFAADENNAIYAAAEENNHIYTTADEQSNIYAAVNETDKFYVGIDGNNSKEMTTDQAATNSKQIKMNKPEMVDNILYHSYEG